MVFWASAAAVALYLVPVAVLLWHGRHRSPIELALSIPLAVAADLLGLLALTLLFPLEVSVLLSRPLWLAGGLTWWWIGRRRPHPASSFRWRDHLPTAAAALGLAALSFSLSRPFAIWDRLWHEPLVASLRGQRLPFTNVFEPGRILHYHFSGDVLGVALQVLSANTIHAARALSLAHDLMFALMGASLALLLRGCGRGPVASAVLPWAVALAGPFTLIPIDDRYRFWGYSLHNFFTLSYRPHTAIFGLLAVGLCAALLDRSRRHHAALLVLLALLGISDEVSSVLLLLGVSAAWLIEPTVLHEKRGRGILLLALGALAIVAANLVFRASLSPGGPASAVQLVPPRAPGFGHLPLPLTTTRGALSLIADLGPTLACAAALFIPGARRSRAPALFALAVLLAGVVGLTAVEINHTPIESHRFMTAAVLVIPLLACATAAGRTAGLLLAGGAALASVSSLAWALLAMPIYGRSYLNVHYTLDCRAATGAHLGEHPVPTYVSPPLWPAYSGCRPLYTAGLAPARQWGISLGPALGPAALPAITALPPQTGPLPVVCGRAHDPDPICTTARSRPCSPAGRDAEICHHDR